MLISYIASNSKNSIYLIPLLDMYELVFFEIKAHYLVDRTQLNTTMYKYDGRIKIHINNSFGSPTIQISIIDKSFQYLLAGQTPSGMSPKMTPNFMTQGFSKTLPGISPVFKGGPGQSGEKV